MTNNTPFYEEGLRFSCTRCSKCCRFDPGYVFLSEADIASLMAHFDASRQEIEERYCRHVEMDGHVRLSLQEQANNDCVFWNDGGCTVYEARPLQCRSFPFWPSYLFSEYTWQSVRSFCPGVGIGELHSRDDVDGWLRAAEQEPYIRMPRSAARTGFKAGTDPEAGTDPGAGTDR